MKRKPSPTRGPFKVTIHVSYESHLRFGCRQVPQRGGVRKHMLCAPHACKHSQQYDANYGCTPVPYEKEQCDKAQHGPQNRGTYVKKGIERNAHKKTQTYQ
jgi:hypothetical protein